MKIKELEKLELRERIIKQMSYELWTRAEEIWEKSNEAKEWRKHNPIIRFWILYTNKDYYNSKKIIQMKLLDKEVNDALEKKKVQ